MKPFIVIGAGLFGSMITHALRARGLEVTLVDSYKENRGSRPAACLMKPSWMSSLDYKPPLAFLEKHVGLETIQFSVRTALGKLTKADVFWSDPKRIMCFKNEAVRQEVLAVRPGEVDLSDGTTMRGNVIVAAGIWSQELLRDYAKLDISALCGSAVLTKGRVEDPTIHVYAPYRQAVWFNRGANTKWFGDGTALIQKSFTADAVQRTMSRATDLAKFSGDCNIVSGMRPYTKGEKNGVFRVLARGLAVSTGGAKNGTILAANHALAVISARKDFL